MQAYSYVEKGSPCLWWPFWTAKGVLSASAQSKYVYKGCYSQIVPENWTQK